MHRPELFVFSPMPPARNGIADYSAELLTGLAAHYECTCIVADDSPAPLIKSLYLSQYRKIASAVAHERHLFQVGNNSGHAYMLPWIERVSGVVTIHDATLAHAMDWIANETGGSEAFFRLAEAADGPQAREILETAVRHGLWFGGLGQEMTFLAPVVSSSRAVIVHSRLARLRVLASTIWARTYVIPHFSAGSSRLPATSRLRSDGTVHLLCLGFVARAKRIDLVLAAMSMLLMEGLDIRLTIAGEIRPEEYDVEAAVEALNLKRHVHLIGYVPEDAIDSLIASADVVVNLRDPTSGETSGTLSRAFAAGRCAVVTDIGTYSEIPDDCVVKVGRSEMNPRGLALRLWRIVTMADEREAIGTRARLFAENASSLVSVARQYARAIEEAYAGDVTLPAPAMMQFMRVPRSRTPHIESLARSTRALADPQQLWWRERMLPLGEGDQILLIAGGTEASSRLAEEGFGWRTQSMVETDKAAVLYDALLFLVDEATLSDIPDSNELLVDLIRKLRPSAKLIIEVSNPAKLPAYIAALLHRHGYRQLSECEGPELPLVNIGISQWSASSWCATFAKLRPAVIGRGGI